MIKTLVAQKQGRYASFPTLVTDADRLWLFYRDGATGRTGTHGRAGRVMSLELDIPRFLEAYETPEAEMTELAEPRLWFAEGNEMDAIVSALGPLGYSLATRTFDENRVMRTFISFSDRPEFMNRQQVLVPELSWFCFYGHAFVEDGCSIHPAYGALAADGVHRPFLLRHIGGSRFEIHARLESEFGPIRLNECSHAFYRGEQHLFMRMDRKPFGIWHSRSANGRDWSRPECLFESAHAPMALTCGDRLFLSFRHILGENQAAIALCEPFANGAIEDLDYYEGNIYDGGYTDLAVIGTHLFIFYYFGNQVGEPSLKVKAKRERMKEEGAG